MANVDESVILKVAQLSKLSVTSEEVQIYIPQFKQVLEHFDELKTLNTDHIEPLITPIELVEHLRVDECKNDYTTEELLNNAPDKMGLLFKVPPVI